IRDLAINNADSKQYLILSDKLRDEDLLNLGVLLEDRDGSTKRDEERERNKALVAAEKERKKQEKIEKAKINPNEMFKIGDYKDLFSKFDETKGFPTHDNKGEELAKSKTKKLRKEFDAQLKLHDQYINGTL
ncbi:hypothetical protein ROZALSC1DRAFT_25152, partial [Rozella allomycis CSF55]